MRAFTGTWRLVRLALRRDRIKLPAWIVALSSMFALSIPAIQESVAATAEERLLYASTVANSIVSRIFEGAIDGPSFGSILTTELFVFMSVLMAFMCTLAVVRHTRQNEESGSAELISSTIVGRYASLSAALIVSIGASLITGLIMFASLAQNEELSTQGSLGLAMALSGVGIAFAGIAAITAQVSETARGANSMAGAAVAASYALRAIGDGFGNVDATGLSVQSMWASWLSPIGWGQQIYPYTQENWWVFSLFVGFAVMAVAAAFLILRHRDVGLGLIATRKGPAVAAKRLLSPLGLGWRLQRGVIYGWMIAFAIYGSLVGGVAKEFEALIQENEMMREMFGAANQNADFADIMFGSMFIYVGAIGVAYCVQALLKMRSEELKGHLEAVAGTAVNRMRWMLSHITWMVIGMALIMFVAGVAAGAVHALVSSNEWIDPLRVGGIALAQLPAMLALAGAIVLVYGVRSSWSTIFAWGSFIGMLVVTQLGAMLSFPQWVMNISPFGHLSTYPAEPLAWTPILLLLSFAVVSTVVGLVAFRKRDFVTN